MLFKFGHEHVFHLLHYNHTISLLTFALYTDLTQSQQVKFLLSTDLSKIVYLLIDYTHKLCQFPWKFSNIAKFSVEKNNKLKQNLGEDCIEL